jgi:hypothetical protein
MSKPKKKKQKILANNVTEQEFLEVLNNISKRLVHKFRFGYHDIDDMKQQAAIFAMEGLEKFDNKRPLENFLWTHVRNRLFNYKRNNYQRPDKPCLTCPLYDPFYKNSSNQCSKYKNKDDCELYYSWYERNNSKKNIMAFHSIDSVGEKEDIKDPFNITQNKEIIDYLDANIVKPEYRESYLKLKNGLKLSKPILEKLKIYIMEIMKNFKKDTSQ